MFLFFAQKGRFAKIAGALLFGFILSVPCNLFGTLLVNDGFPVGEGGYATTQTSLKSQEISDTSVEGFEWTKWNRGSGSGVVYSFGSESGLDFPESFAAHGFVATGGSAGLHATSVGNPRISEKMLDSTILPSKGKLYFRFLMNIDSTCEGCIAKPTDASKIMTASTCYAAGLSAAWDAEGGHYDYFFTTARNVLIGVAKNLQENSEIMLSIISAVGSQTVCTLVAADKFKAGQTYLCLVEIDINAGDDNKERIRAAAFPVGTYSPNFKWATLDEDDVVEAEIWSDDAHPSYVGIGGRYQTNNGYFKVDEIAIGTLLSDVVYSDHPSISTSGLECDGASFEVSATLAGTASARLLAIVDDGTTVTSRDISSEAEPGVAKSAVLSGLAPNATYAIYVAAENECGAVTNFAGTIYSGTPSIAREADADEVGLAAGAFSVLRQGSAFDLTVNYTCSGTAVNGVHCEELSGTVVIPAGATSVSVPVVPIVARPHYAATQLDVTIAAGNYIVTEPAPSASVIIANRAPPAASNTWIAAENGNASLAENWSFGRVPVATDDILIDGTFSTAQLTWDGATEGMVATVASWTQSASYTGRVVMPTTRTGAFTCFTVTGDAVLNGGEWWRAGNAKSDNLTAKVWLNIAIGGNLTVGTEFKFNGYAAGYPKQRGPSQGGEKGGAGGAHGGLGGGGTYGNGTAYGDYLNPTTLGSGQYGSDNGGGGAIVLNVAGDFILDGVVTSDGGDGGTGSGQSGGSVWIQAKTMTGSGTVTAEGGSPSNKRAGGGGGRISIQLSSPAFSREDFAGEFTGTLTAAGGFDPSSGSYARLPGAAGTVYVECAPDNGRGAMTLKNKIWSGANAHTAVAPIRDGETWNLAALDLKVNGRVGVYSGGTLRLPSFAAITGDGSQYAIFLFNGGSVESDIRHDKLVADGFGIENYGTSSFADHTLVVPATSSLKVAGDFTVGSLKINGDTLAVGDYSAATLAETYSNVSGDGTIHVAGVQVGLSVIVR